jgi:AhpD family alkylhydroperoxidase
MSARMTHPAFALTAATAPLMALGAAAKGAGLPTTTIELVNLRCSQINGCSVCLHMHARDLRKAGETDERIDTVAGWRDTPWFTDAERAALALAEDLTRLADRPDAVPDEVYAAAAEHYDEQQLAALILAIGVINLWNRLNIAVRQEAGTGY